MPTIYLKPQSPEYADKTEQKNKPRCAMPGCEEAGEHKAPKDRSLSGYLKLCKEHVREYNQAWNYFIGMSDNDIYQHMYKSSLWDRPTWSFKHPYTAFEEQLKSKAWQAAMGMDAGEEEPGEPNASDASSQYRSFDTNSPEGQAMEVMDLTPPLTLDKIKTRYKSLMKKHHPDLRKGDKNSEELVKKINMAYTVLKMSYQKFEKMAENFK